jgi:hypothetical protein
MRHSASFCLPASARLGAGEPPAHPPRADAHLPGHHQQEGGRGEEGSSSQEVAFQIIGWCHWAAGLTRALGDTRVWQPGGADTSQPYLCCRRSPVPTTLCPQSMLQEYFPCHLRAPRLPGHAPRPSCIPDLKVARLYGLQMGVQWTAVKEVNVLPPQWGMKPSARH